MKRLAIAAAAALAMLGSAHAQKFSTANAYGELGWTFLKIDGGDFSVRPSAIRGILGYDFHPYLGAELMLMGGVNDDDTTVSVLGVPTNVNIKLQNSYGLYLKPKYTWNNQVELFARLGWARSKVKTSVSALGLTGSGSDSDDDFSWGLGANYMFNPRMGVGLDYTVYYDKGDTKVDGWTVSFKYRF